VKFIYLVLFICSCYVVVSLIHNIDRHGLISSRSILDQKRNCPATTRPPPANVRTGPRPKMDDDAYLSSAKKLALTIELQLTNALRGVDENKHKYSELDYKYTLDNKKILDFGVGAGRLLTGLKAIGTCYKKFSGVDVDAKRIMYLEEEYKDDKRDSFYRINIHNDRYNKNGVKLEDSNEALEDLGLPLKKDEYDLIHLNSVFSHMIPEDIQKHLKALKAYLNKTGILYVTLFVRDSVEEFIENPAEVTEKKESALLVAVINRQLFEKMVHKNGYNIVQLSHYTNQHAYILQVGPMIDPSSKRA